MSEELAGFSTMQRSAVSMKAGSTMTSRGLASTSKRATLKYKI